MESFRATIRRAAMAATVFLGLSVLPAGAAVLVADFTSDTTVPLTMTPASYLPPGNTVRIALHYAPTTGTTLTILKNTGLAFIQGEFSNLAQGQAVALEYGGTTYNFIVNYYGGDGNDLVLQWADTRLLGWGYGGNGELGFSGASSALPVSINTNAGALTGKKVLSYATGPYHNLAVCSDGTVAAWGYNVYVQLGNNSTASSSVPVAVYPNGALAGKKVVAVTAGIFHSLALCSDGTVCSWGNNSSGQLGNGTLGINWGAPVPVFTGGVIGSRKVVAVAAGLDHSLALLWDGTMVAWGANNNGALGTGGGTSPVPVPVYTSGALAGKTVVSISAGTLHNLALCSDGTLVAWGYNGDGQLGDGTTNISTVPEAINSFGALAGRTVVAISAGETLSTALCSDGAVITWGYDGTTTLLTPAVKSGGALAGKTVTSVSAAIINGLAFCSDGAIATWGSGGIGMLGNGSTVNTVTPVAVSMALLGPGERFINAYNHLGLHTLAVAATAPPAAPAIHVSLDGTGIDNGTGAVNFGSWAVLDPGPANSTTRTLTITNAGGVPLSLGAISVDGAAAADFVVSPPAATTLASGASTTLTVAFAPHALGARAAALHIASNAPAAISFDIDLLGSGTPPVPVITSPGAVGGMVGSAFNYTITATNSPTAYAAAGLPDGLALDTTTGVISGTPIEAGEFEVLITATDAGGSDTDTLEITIEPAPTPVPTPTPESTPFPPAEPPGTPPPGDLPPGTPPPSGPPPTPLPTPSTHGQTIFSTEEPVLSEANDSTPYELGMKFQADVAGDVNAIRYWKTPSETGVHVGHIWAADGTELASVTFTDETASGWQEQALAAPLAIAANTTYVVSVNSYYYPFTGYGLLDPVINGHVRSVADGANGVFGPAAAFPTSTYHSANYFRDVAFTPAAPKAVLSVVNDWSSGFQGRIVVNNPTPDRLETWSVEADFTNRQITTMWGADYELLSTSVDGAHTIYHYKLTPPDWSKRINPGASVEIGFLASPGGVQSGDVAAAAPAEVTHSSAESATYVFPAGSVTVNKSGDWQQGAVLRFTITNSGAEPLTDWQFTMDFDRSIASIWNATVHDAGDTVSTVDAQDYPWHKDVSAGGSVEFGFISSPGALTDLPLVTTLISTTPAPEPEPTPTPANNSFTRRSGVVTLHGGGLMSSQLEFVAPNAVSVGKSTASVKVATGLPAESISAKTKGGAKVTVSGKNPYRIKVTKLDRGRTKVTVVVVTADGRILRRTIRIIRR